MGALLAVLGVLAAIVVGVFAIVYLVVPIFKGLGWVLAQIGRFVLATVTDVARLIGSIVTGLVYIPMVMGTLVIGRWSSSSHYGRAIQDEFAAVGKSVYRLFVGNPLRLVGMGGVMEGVEKRVPAVMAGAPGADRPPARAGQFEGYKIVGSLQVGGSGAKLYVAEPDEMKRAALLRGGMEEVGQVVIKSFSLRDGSTLPQIVRESRSLDAAKRLRLILDYELAPERFYYVMRYVPGENLSLVTQRLHAQSDAGGLSPVAMKAALSYTADLARTLDDYHRGGLWHKDVKPDNIIVDARDGRAHLVDFGLVSSLRSAMTLTTHGTEYFRDPEMVRMALRGVKVQDVDGSKFDLFGTGAVLYSLVEDSFPAHGVLSQFSKRVPESLKWIIRRAMTDYDKRYGTAAELLRDLETVMAAADPFALRPIDLPSMRNASLEPEVTRGPVAAAPHVHMPAGAGVAGGVGAAGAAGVAVGAAAMAGVGAGSRFPKLRVKNWWTGSFEQDGHGAVGSPHLDEASRWVNRAAASSAAAAEKAAKAAKQAVDKTFGNGGAGVASVAANEAAQKAGQHVGRAHEEAMFGARVAPAGRRSATAQLASARGRVEAAQGRAAARTPRRATEKPFKAGVNPGMVFAIVAFFGAATFLVTHSMREQRSNPQATVEMRDGVGFRDEAAAFEEGADALASKAAAKVMPTSVGRVLVVNDLVQPVDSETAAEVRALMERFAARGVDVVEADGALDATAALRFAVGKTPIDAEGTRETVLKWLESNTGEADGVVWMSSTKKSGGSVEARTFVRSGGDDAARLGRVQLALQGALQGAVRGAVRPQR